MEEIDMKLNADFFEKLEAFWKKLWEVIDKILQEKYGEDYKELD